MAPSPPTRRNGTTTPKSTISPPSPEQPATKSQKPATSALITLLPTPLETLLLTLYPTLLLLGSLYALLSSTTRSTPYSPTTQSYPQNAHAPSIFALKSNLLNTFFVKVAWFWVSTSYLSFLLLHPSTGPPGGLILTPKRVRGILRWLVATLWWGVVTQWFFGPALIDRGFRVTGGACLLAERYEGVGGGMEFVSAQTCKAVGGVWSGGHDISGHVFILVLGSAFLGMEILPALAGARGVGEERRIVTRGGEMGRVERDGVEDGDGEGKWGIGLPMVVMGLSWWMLLMTAAFFHTWFEKFTGLLTAFLGVFVVYYLPRASPAMRGVLGIPGI